VTTQNKNRREVVGIISRREDFDAAVTALNAAGFGHADLSVLASHDSLDAANPGAASWKEALTGLLGELRYQGPLVVAGFIALVAEPVLAAAAVAIAAGVGGVAVKELLDEVTARPHAEAFAKALADGQLLLWVQVADASREAEAKRVLAAANAREIHANERPGD
jgi:hypothetical protein